MEKVKEVPAPASLTDEQIMLAKAFIHERHEKGISITDFCSKYSKSSKTWYEWLKDDAFNGYLTALGGSIISEDERSAFQQVKKKIMANATKQNASPRDIELFLSTFSYIVEAEKAERMNELGITPEAYKDRQENTTVEEKKARLLTRLMG